MTNSLPNGPPIKTLSKEIEKNLNDCIYSNDAPFSERCGLFTRKPTSNFIISVDVSSIQLYVPAPEKDAKDWFEMKYLPWCFWSPPEKFPGFNQPLHHFRSGHGNVETKQEEGENKKEDDERENNS